MFCITRSKFLLGPAILFGAVAAQAQVTGGITSSAFGWEDGRREQALAAVIQVAPARWLMLGTVPTLLRAQSSPSADARTGFGDLPVYAALVHAGNGPSRPTIAVTGSASLPTGDSERGLGRGVSVVSGEFALGVDPAPGLTVRAGGARLLRVAGQPPGAVPTSTLFGDVVLGSGSPTSLSLGGFAELRGAAGETYEPGRGISGALAHTLRSGPTLLLGAGHSLAGPGPAWSFSIGFGTAFGGVAPIGATAPASRATGGVPRSGGRLAPALCSITGC